MTFQDIPKSGVMLVADADDEIIRTMTRDDLALVHALECAVQKVPWSQQHFIEELEKPFSRIDLCWRGSQLAGFLCSWMIAGELQIQNVATAPAFRRQGVARRLLTRLLERAEAVGFDSAWLEVRVSNAAAILLYERFGFRTVGRRRDYYADGEDALVMCCRPDQKFP